MGNVSELESSLWAAADNLRANSKLTSSEYCMPVLGIIFLRHATNRYAAAVQQIESEQASGRMPRRPLTAADFLKRRALLLPAEARYDSLTRLPKGASLGSALVEAMNAIERDFEPLRDQLPKDYERFGNDLLEDLLRVFDSESLRRAEGDVFGRIYEYFLMKFAMQGAQDNGEFFTPPALVQMIVNVIEPERGIIFDPACGSGGMFVQSSHFVETLGLDAGHRLTFYGQEKTGTTIRLAKMNLAVHGLEGDIREANTFYDDVHTLYGRCDRVMANPPFNVDMVDAEKAMTDRRLPFGLPGVNKANKVSNGNYLWISYFWSYLKATGRAGFVMSSQASSAGNQERDVRRKLVETGDVDVMVAIRSNFFYTRTVPCELWFFDRAKPAPSGSGRAARHPAGGGAASAAPNGAPVQPPLPLGDGPEAGVGALNQKGNVLMLDARNVYRKVTRKIYDFSPEQLRNLSAVVWLYRGQQDRFLGLVRSYVDRLAAACGRLPEAQGALAAALDAVRGPLAAFAGKASALEALTAEKRQALTAALAAWQAEGSAFAASSAGLLEDLAAFCQRLTATPAASNAQQHAARQAFEPLAVRAKALLHQLDGLGKLAGRATQAASDLAGEGPAAGLYERRAASRRLKDLDDARQVAAEPLQEALYLHRQIAWLQERFPEAVFAAVPGLCRVVSQADIAAADWSLTPGRYVGVAPAEVDADFDFAQAIRDIHAELADLNRDAAALAATIQANLEGLAL
ncbi:MAG: N-6 DNA methylase [Lentisphaerae bacterium]|nr:N-6 DNA methylase [Lentisphaerota bacterium]